MEDPDRSVLIYGMEGQCRSQIALQLMCQTRDSQMIFQEASTDNQTPLLGDGTDFSSHFLGLENTKTVAVPHICGQEQHLCPAGRLIPWVNVAGAVSGA